MTATSLLLWSVKMRNNLTRDCLHLIWNRSIGDKPLLLKSYDVNPFELELTVQVFFLLDSIAP